MLFAVLLASVGLLIAALTPRRGIGVAAIIAVLLVASGVSGTVQGISQDQGNDTLSGWAGLISPFGIVDGVQVWAFGATSSVVEGPPGTVGGPVFALVAVALIAACYALLVRRYRRVSVVVSTLTLSAVSRWFGNVVAVNDVTMTVGPGVTGLLGPNGAGKSTLIDMMSGFLAPSSGTVTLDGAPVWRNEEVYRDIGLVPETRGDVRLRHRLGVRARQRPAARAARPGRRRAPRAGPGRDDGRADREIGTYSKGMKQRVKMASALVHDPAVLLLDEPFNGMDPRQRLHLMELLPRMGDDGRTVLFCSHILEEVEQIATTIEVVVAGRHAASGDFREIRRLMTERPHRYPVTSSDDRALAAALIADGCASAVDLGDTLRVQVGRLRAVHPRAAAHRPRPRHPAVRGRRRPTSRWRASSPTW